MQNLRILLTRPDLFPYPYLVDVLKRLTALPQFKAEDEQIRERTDGLPTTDNDVVKAHPADGGGQPGVG